MRLGDGVRWGDRVTLKSPLDAGLIIVCLVFSTAVIETLATGLCSSSSSSTWVVAAAPCGRVLISRPHHRGAAPPPCTPLTLWFGFVVFFEQMHFPGSRLLARRHRLTFKRPAIWGMRRNKRTHIVMERVDLMPVMY